MSAPSDGFLEPDASSSAAERRRTLTLVGLFLAGPSLWITHFMVVYLLAEAMCHAEVEARLFGLPLLSTVTLLATAVAFGGVAMTTLRAYRRWRHAGVAWESPDAESAKPAAHEHDAELSLAAFLLGLLFLAGLLFVGLPAVVLDPCAP